jgi:hypothetical protein
MANYTNISLADMESFLAPQGFKIVPVEGTRETVWAKRVFSTATTIPLCVRVYSGITGQSSRECGEDAIRVTLFTKLPDARTVIVAGSKRVHRVEHWRENLQERLDKFANWSPDRICKEHNLPLCERKAKGKGRQPFYGCPLFPSCRYTEPA